MIICCDTTTVISQTTQLISSTTVVVTFARILAAGSNFKLSRHVMKLVQINCIIARKQLVEWSEMERSKVALRSKYIVRVNNKLKFQLVLI